jgi:Flp pilus assembly protein TadD
LAQALSQLNQGDKAMTVLRDAALQAGGNLRLQAALARTLADNGRTAEARNEYDLILSQFQLDERDRDVVARERAALNSGQ